MAPLKDRLALVRALARNPQILRAGPAINLFMLRYLRKFRPVSVGRNVILHSHLPPLNSPAYRRFVNEHLLARLDGPSHAQVGLTNECPQHCAYCYNKGRSGEVMDTPAVMRVIADLKSLGVFWLGLTGGEPLLNRDIVRIVESAGGDCAVKLFTTGATLTPDLAAALRDAGLFSVSVSLDHWREAEHDRARGTPGAFRDALRAIEIFKSVGGLQVGVSAVLTRGMIREGKVDELLSFLTGLGVHEAWLSEVKPSVRSLWSQDLVITDEEQRALAALQDRYNRQGRITVNYLGHFEGREHFGCNAGCKMVYVDAFGEVGPCVFVPMTFGNVRKRPVRDILADMRRRFPGGDSCFINRHYARLAAAGGGRVPLDRAASESALEGVEFGPPPRFFKIFYE
ncbi:MAG: radical SAM protein [Candidatus Aminicenantes bacterium RBG_16_63_16]|nr:MAG: radical SAM protein [Candidatus Aminicenantes bacterium RBG_16_63_16]